MKETLRAKVQDVDALRALLMQAHQAGMDAGRAVVPPAMVVRQHRDQLDDNSPVAHEWIVPEGPCGFAWVTVRPANSRLARVMALVFDGSFGGEARRDTYAGGMMLWVWEFDQSATRKEAYARAFARTLTEAGHRAQAGNRLD